MRLYTLRDAELVIAKNLHRIRGFDTIMGVPRSGMIFASFIATQLEVALADVGTAGRSLKVLKHGGIEQVEPKDFGKILLVEDVVNSGASLRDAFEVLAQAGIKRDQITTCSVWAKPGSEIETVDIDLGGPYDSKCCFTWQMWHSVRWPKWATDMDGVLCADAPDGERTHEEYSHWAQTVTPKWLPAPRRHERYKIGTIITSRPEGIRHETLDWLHRHNVLVNRLIMIPVADEASVNPWLKSQRLNRGRWKAQEARQITGIELFIESHSRQAEVISENLECLVWCTDTQDRYRSGAIVTE